MPVNQSSDLSLLHGLSGFWTSFFKDTASLRAYYRGVEVNIGQLYLELLENVLSTSIAHAPAFSKQYYHQFTISEDALFYKEGPSPSDDRYVFTAQNFKVADAPCLMNTIVDPQNVLETGRDYDVFDYGLRFYQNPFTSLSGFPTRTVMQSYPSVYRDPRGTDWAAAGAKAGDTLRVRSLGSPNASTSMIRVVDAARLYLDASPAEFSVDYTLRSFKVTVLRAPYDAVQHGVPVLNHNHRVVALGEAAVVGGTVQIDFGAESYYRGTWAAATAYVAGDLAVNPFGVLARAAYDHVSGGSYTGAEWDDLSKNYIYVEQPSAPANNGLLQVDFTVGGVATMVRGYNFEAGPSVRAKLTFVAHSPLMATGLPKIQLQHTFVDAASFQLNARRDHDVVTPQGVFPAGQQVIEGVDYLLDAEHGIVHALSGWDPIVWPRASYTWQYEVATRDYVARGAFVTFVLYNPGDVVRHAGNAYACTTTHFAVSFDATKWALFAPAFDFEVTREVRQMAMWGADVLYDRDTLYENFGYLLAFRRPSSEQYRAFLRGVAQLFVLGPTLGRFESALNVMAGLPVVRDDGETLHSYSDGIDFAGSGGQTIDVHDGRDGVLSSTGRFTAASASFFTSDIGGQLRVRVNNFEGVYTITAVLSGTEVLVTPTPPDATEVVWTAQHVELQRRFRTAEMAFVDSDRDGEIEISGATHAANNGRFRIVSVENASTVILSAEFALRDEVGLAWRLSRSKNQEIVTSRATYQVPYHVPVREDVKDATNWSRLVLNGFEPLSAAFHVTDYIQDATWWHNIDIPKEVLSYQVETAGRRKASPDLIEHTLSPLDGAGLGDPGLWVGADEQGTPGILREGEATWFGGDTLVLTTPDFRALPRDVGRYAIIDGVSYKIVGINETGETLRLLRFPPRSLRGVTPPRVLEVKLPTLVYRRSVGFVMMDKFLKYHALRVSIHPTVPLSGSLLGEAVELLRQAKPAYTLVYMDTPLTFYERVIAQDSMDLAVGVPMSEGLTSVDNRIFAADSGLELDDAFRFTAFTQSIAGAPGVYALTPTLPAAGAAPRTVRFHVVKGRFDLTAMMSGRRIVEGLDYTLDRTTGTLTVLQALPGPVDFNYWAVILRKRLVGDTLDGGETRISMGGANPITWANAAAPPGQVGLIDRAVQLILAP